MRGRIGGSRTRVDQAAVGLTGKSSIGFQPIGVSLTRGAPGRMAFVPEGQLDSSQARCAWSHEENSAVPAGRLNGSRLRLKASEQQYLAFHKRH